MQPRASPASGEQQLTRAVSCGPCGPCGRAWQAEARAGLEAELASAVAAHADELSAARADADKQVARLQARPGPHHPPRTS